MRWLIVGKLNNVMGCTLALAIYAVVDPSHLYCKLYLLCTV